MSVAYSESREPQSLPAVIPTSLPAILAEVSAKHQIPVDVILTSLSRVKRIVHARQEFWWRARLIFTAEGKQRYSLNQLSAYHDARGRLDHFDHTTVLHGAIQHRKRLRDETILRVMAENDKARPGGPMTPLEKAARAIHMEDPRWNKTFWLKLMEATRERYFRQARAALVAVRSCPPVSATDDPSGAARSWETLIDAIV